MDAILTDLLPFYKKLPDLWKKRLLANAQQTNFQKGTLLHAGEERCSGLFILISGRVKAYMVTEAGKEITLFRLMNRDVCIFSASCLMKNITFDVCMQDGKVYAIELRSGRAGDIKLN